MRPLAVRDVFVGDDDVSVHRLDNDGPGVDIPSNRPRQYRSHLAATFPSHWIPIELRYTGSTVDLSQIAVSYD